MILRFKLFPLLAPFLCPMDQSFGCLFPFLVRLARCLFVRAYASFTVSLCAQSVGVRTNACNEVPRIMLRSGIFVEKLSDLCRNLVFVSPPSRLADHRSAFGFDPEILEVRRVFIDDRFDIGIRELTRITRERN